jgi:H+/gluconate symporter-like permease
MEGAARFLAQFFPLFLLGAVFGKLMEDSGSVSSVATLMTKTFGERHVMLAVVLAGAVVTYGGVSLFVAFFVLVPMAQTLFHAAAVPRRLVPAAIVLGTSTFTMSALPGTPSIQNAIPMPFFGTTLFAAPGLGTIAAIIMLGFGFRWLIHAKTAAGRAGEGYGADMPGSVDAAVDDELVRERATTAREFDPAEIRHGGHGAAEPAVLIAVLPLVAVIAVNLVMSLAILPRIDSAYLAEARWGGTTIGAVAGVWSVVVALALAIAVVVLLNRARLPQLRQTMDAGANASVLPAVSVASLVGFGAVIAALPAFAAVRDWVLAIEGGPLVSLAVAINVLAGLTGSASGGLTIALDVLGQNYMAIAAQAGINPALMHRVAVIGAGTLDTLPHNGAVVTLLALCGASHRGSYFDIVMVGIVGPVLALIAVIGLGTVFGSF